MLSLPTAVPDPVFWIRELWLRAEDTLRVCELIPRCPGLGRQWCPPELGGQGWLPLGKVEKLSCVSPG